MAGEICGAASGAVLAIGLLTKEEPETAAVLTNGFVNRFEKLNGAVRCMEIIGFNIGGATTGNFEISSLKKFLRFILGGGRRRCSRVVKNAVNALLVELNQLENKGLSKDQTRVFEG